MRIFLLQQKVGGIHTATTLPSGFLSVESSEFCVSFASASLCPRQFAPFLTGEK